MREFPNVGKNISAYLLLDNFSVFTIGESTQESNFLLDKRTE